MRVPGGTPLSHGARVQQRSIVGLGADDSCLQLKFDSIISMPTLLYGQEDDEDSQDVQQDLLSFSGAPAPEILRVFMYVS